MTESRLVAGSDAGGLRAHILAHCCKCGAEGSLPVAKRAGSVPADAGQKMFRARFWRMAPNNRAKDVCPACSGRAKIASSSEEHRAQTALDVVSDLLHAADGDPRYMGQKDFQRLLSDFPELSEVAHDVLREWEAEGRAPITDTFARAEATIQAALARMRQDPDVDPELLAEIDESLAATYEAMALSAQHVINDLQAQDQREEKAAKEADMTPHPSRPATALADAFRKAQAQKIKADGEGRKGKGRLKIESASLGDLIKDQQRDDRRGVKLVGAKHKAPLPRSLSEPAKAGVAEAIVKAVQAPEAEPAPRKRKYHGGWDRLSPEERAARIAYTNTKRNEAFARKAGLTLEEWTTRNEARKAALAAGGAPAAPTPQAPPPTPKPKPVAASPAPIPTPIQPETPRMTDPTSEPSSVQRIAIRAALDTHYIPLDVDGGGGYYVGDFSDAKLAESLAMPRAWIENRRNVMDLGPDRNEAQTQIAGAVEGLRTELAELTASLPQLLDESLAEADDVKARLTAEFTQEITRIGAAFEQRAKDELAKAGDAHASRVAKVETRISDIEKRLTALAGGKRL